MVSCILDERKKNGCNGCDFLCQNKIAISGFNGDGGRIGAAGAPSSYLNLTLATSPAKDAQKDIYSLLEKAVETFPRQFDKNGKRIKSWYLWSESPGTGKTTTAVALMNEFIMTNYIGHLVKGEQPPQLPAMFFDLNNAQRTYNIASQSDDKATVGAIAKRFDKASSVPFLVLDDIGLRKASDAFRGLVRDVVDYRTANDLPTVYTSNIPITEMTTIYDKTIYDRIRDQCGVLHFEGESNRGRR